MTLLTRCYPFSASHRLHVEALGSERNRELFGKCNNPFGHGHNYRLHVGVRGEADPETGLAMPRRALDELVAEEVLDVFDRRDLNADVPEFVELNPTTENLALVISRRLCRGWRERGLDERARLSRVRLEETGRNVFDLELE